MSVEIAPIYDKLEHFINKYYKNQIIKGTLILLLYLVLSYLLIIVSEYLGHFSVNVRTIFFYAFILIAVSILAILIVKPLLSFLKITKRLDYYQVSNILEEYFPEIKDHLRNVLELKDLQEKTYSKELITAAVQQKTKELSPIPFYTAIQIKKSLKHFLWILFPVANLVFLYLYNPAFVTEPTKRIINHNVFYQAPAPFTFILENDSLNVKKGSDLNIRLHFEGEYIPNPVYIKYGGLTYLMQKNKNNQFEYTFKNVNNDFLISFEAEDISSKEYKIRALPTPDILNFTIEIIPPKYTGEKVQKLKNTGDFIAPEGSLVHWSFQTKETNTLWIKNEKDEIKLSSKDNLFSYQLKLKESFAYTINIANQLFAKNNLFSFNATSIADAYPLIIVQSLTDSAQMSLFYFKGKLEDDYGITKIMFSYKTKKDSVIHRIKIPLENQQPVQEFYYMYDFSEIIKLGETVEYYFEVWDNDQVNGSKSTRSEMFSFELPSKKEIEKMDDANTQSIKDKLQETQKLSKELQKEVRDFKESMINQKLNSWELNQKLKNISQKQSSLERLMKEISKENEKNNKLLEKLNPENKKLLEKQKQIENLMKNLIDKDLQKLLDEINQLMSKFKKEKFNDLSKKMDMSYKDLSEQLDRNLEQLKRYEVEKKMQQQIDALKELAKKQEDLSEETEADRKNKKKNIDTLIEKQKQQEKEMQEIAKKAKETAEKNKALQKPMSLDDFSEQMKNLQQEMQKATESLEKKQSKKAAAQEKSNAQKMQQLAQQMQQSLNSATQQQQMQDEKSLQQIVENLLIFSFEQEDIMLNFRKINSRNSRYIKLANRQSKITSNFALIKDSLYALARTQPMLASPINKEVLNIEEQLERAKVNIEERKSNRTHQAQQMVMTAANNLNLLLNEVLQQMKMQAQSQCQKSGSCSNPNGNKPKPGMGKMKQQAQSLKSQLENMLGQLKKGMGSKSGQKQINRALGKMIAEQEKMQKMFSEMSNSNGISPKLAQQLKEIKKLSQQIEKDLINKKITAETLRRQERILTRLLEAENADYEREIDKKRQANSVQNKKISKPKDIFKYQKETQNIDDILMRSKIHLHSFYKKKYINYLLNLHHE